MSVVFAADESTRELSRDAVREMIRKLGEDGQRNLDAVYAALDEARTRLRSLLATGSDFDQARARGMIQAISQELSRLRHSLTPTLSQGFRDALTMGDDDAVTQAMAVLPDAPLAISTGVSPLLIEVATVRSADLVGQITETARAKLDALMLRSATGTSRPADVARDIGTVLAEEGRPTGVFGDLATQIERVHRTETASLYEAAAKARATQIARESPWIMRERWITLLDGRERADHRDMNGALIDFGEQFNYGAGPIWSKVSYEQATAEGGELGLPCMGPHDSILPAEAVVQCRCARALVRGPRRAGR